MIAKTIRTQLKADSMGMDLFSLISQVACRVIDQLTISASLTLNRHELTLPPEILVLRMDYRCQ